MRHRLIEIEWPDFGMATRPEAPSVEEYEARIEAARERMRGESLTHLVVYGDREHFGNMTYLTGFDPRFEEALLVLTHDRDPLLIVGNECEAYLPVSPLYKAGKLRHERYQPFSLLSQPRDSSRELDAILAGEHITTHSTVGCVGWKYFYHETEEPDKLDIPAYIADSLRKLAGEVWNATGLFMNPRDGLRTSCSPAEIAFFEYSNVLASEAMKQLIFALRDGILDTDLARQAQYPGLPFNCHMTLVTEANRDQPLGGPMGATIRRGSVFASNIGYWGSNICRAGWVAESADDLPEAARDYVESFAGPYFEAMGEWFGMLRIGVEGGKLWQLIREKLPYEKFGIYLNPGHLIHLDEWVSSPIYRDSYDPIRSGMVMQVDVIPASATYFSTRMEDGVVIADVDLRAQLEAQYPECYARCQERRAFMTNTLGIDLPDEILPLSNIPAIVPPFFLSPNRVLALV
jgi:Xaa-Pro aminopeptidase